MDYSQLSLRACAYQWKGSMRLIMLGKCAQGLQYLVCVCVRVSVKSQVVSSSLRDELSLPVSFRRYGGLQA